MKTYKININGRSRVGACAGPIISLRGVNKSRSILAAGAEFKNVFCLTKSGKAYMSQYIGDLNNKETFGFYKKAIKRYKYSLKVKPKIIAHDLHPNYLSSLFASQLKTHDSRLITLPVQHHQAHIASVIAEKNINKPVIGFAFDGAGYGLDGNIWGGECFIYSKRTFTRAAHFEYFELPGGDIATKEIWRLAVSILRKAGVSKLPKHIRSEKYCKEIVAMIEKHINSPLCCSVGRIFDAVASIIGIRNEVTFEAQAAMELESLSLDIPVKKGYNFKIRGQGSGGRDQKKRDSENHNNPLIVSTTEIIKQIWQDKKSGVKPGVIGARFHLTLAEIILELSIRFRDKYKINDIVLSGGVFQNNLLLSHVKNKLKLYKFNLYYNQLVPINDGGISLGQAWIAAKQVRSF
ncbi:MAG: hypothetical protein LHV68_03260 [Elusimicrobia bacterium]|nr:hypothetical protein [Candidatus Liberimonas magnetica]